MKNSVLHATNIPAPAVDASLTERRMLDLIAANDQLIKNLLSDARSVLEDGETWAPVVQILHPEGVHSLIAPGLIADTRQRPEVFKMIDRLVKELNGYLVIMLADNWIPEENPDNYVDSNPESPLYGRSEALVLATWGPAPRWTTFAGS